jgi:hypothetical protein
LDGKRVIEDNLINGNLNFQSLSDQIPSTQCDLKERNNFSNKSTLVCARAFGCVICHYWHVFSDIYLLISKQFLLSSVLLLWREGIDWFLT